MVELATLELNAKTDGLTRGVTALKALEQQAAQTEAVTNKLTTGTEAVSKSLTMTSGNAKLFMQQLSQIAQQGAATGQWAQAFSIQIADMGSAFGVWGMAVGAIATVGLPLLVGALSNAGTAATTAKDAVEALQTAQKGLKESQDILSLSFADLVVKYGNYASAVRDAAAALAELQLAQAKADLANSLKDANGEISYLLEQTRAGFQNIRDEFGTTSEQTQTLAADFRAIRDAASIEDRLAAFAALSAHMKAIGVDTSKLPEALLQAMANGAQLSITMAELAAQANKTADAAARIPQNFGGTGTVRSIYSDLLAASANTTTSTATGGGAAKTDTLQTQLESLQRSLMSQEEAENASYARRQATLQAALDQRKITQEQYQELSEDLWKQHNQKLEDIDIYRYGTAAEKARLFFADMASSLQSGNDGMLRASRIFGAASALINAWLAYSQTLADPTLPWWAKIPKALAVLSAGFAAVNAIKSGSTSASKASSSSVGKASTASTATASKTVTVEIQGDTAYANLLRQNIQVIAEALQAEAGIGGFVVA